MIANRIKTRLLTLIFLLAPLTAVLAQTSDKKSQDILHGVSTKYRSLASVKADFSLSSQNPKNNTKSTESGTLYIKGEKYRLQIAGQDVISDGKSRWTYVKDANEVQIDNQRNDENAITPTSIFTMYEKGWISKFIGESKQGATVVQQLELAPADPKKKAIFKVKLTINKTEKSIMSAVMYDKNGLIQTITVTKYVPNGVKDDSLFLFTATSFPGAEVIDLR